MALSMKNGYCIYGFSSEIQVNKQKGFGFSSLKGSVQFKLLSKTLDRPDLKREFKGRPAERWDHRGSNTWVSHALRWWDQTHEPNMIEIKSAQELVDTLQNAGDRLVIVDFYSPGCGGCRALHPKICQIAELNPDALFLKVNLEKLKDMCYSLNIHVLPFFRFYRGAEGRLCSFSCTNATIKKFKNALLKHGSDRCSLGTAKGLEESELKKLALGRKISFDKPHGLAYH